MKMLIVLNKYLELLSRLVYSLLMNVDVISFDKWTIYNTHACNM